MPEHPLLNFFDQLKIDNTVLPEEGTGSGDYLAVRKNPEQDFPKRDLQRGGHPTGISGNQPAQ